MPKDSKRETLTSGLDVTELLEEIGSKEIKLPEFKSKIADFAKGKNPEVLVELFQEKLEKMNPEVVVEYFSEIKLSEEANIILTTKAESVKPESPSGVLTYFMSLTPGGLDNLEELNTTAKANIAKALGEVKLREFGAGPDGAINPSNATENILGILKEQIKDLKAMQSSREVNEEFKEEVLDQKNGLFDRIVNSLSSMFENISEFFSAITGSISGLFSSKSSAQVSSEVSLLGDSPVDTPGLERGRGSSVDNLEPAIGAVDDAARSKYTKAANFVESARARSGSESGAPSPQATAPGRPRSLSGSEERSR